MPEHHADVLDRHSGGIKIGGEGPADAMAGFEPGPVSLRIFVKHLLDLPVAEAFAIPGKNRMELSLTLSEIILV